MKPTILFFMILVVSACGGNGKKTTTAPGPNPNPTPTTTSTTTTTTLPPPADTDGDGIADSLDNCLNDRNADQANADGDSRGDACDNCKNSSNSDQADEDRDGFGDACDNCDRDAGSNQTDTNNDGQGDLCDDDDDGDGISDSQDRFSKDPRETKDTDNDGVGDNGDFCPTTSDASNRDQDLDGVGDVCDKCPTSANRDQADSDNDGRGNVCDNCPNMANPNQENLDNDTLGDACDDDSDGDGKSRSLAPIDCNDRDATVFPGAVEKFDFKDNNCDTIIDKGLNLGNLSTASIRGQAPNDYFGQKVAGIGDINGDGKADFLAGAHFADSPPLNLNGKIYLFYGKSTFPNILNADEADVIIQGSSNSEQIGLQMSSGDINGDTKSDLLIGSPYAANGKGSVYVLFSRNTSLPETIDVAGIGGGISGLRFDGENAGDGLGITATGDLNKDGCRDMILGSPLYNTPRDSDVGRVYIYYGRGGACDSRPALTGIVRVSGSTADATISGESADDQFGSSLVSGDVNGDGADDLIIGAPYFNATLSNTGKVYVLYGGKTANLNRIRGSLSARTAPNVTFTGGTANHYLGQAMAMGNIQGDAKEDLVLGVPEYDQPTTNTGRLHILQGAEIGTSGAIDVVSTARFSGESIGNYLGQSISVSGDYNGDGKKDLLVGAWGNSENGPSAGKIYLVPGTAQGYAGDISGIQNLGATFVGEANLNYAGYSVSNAGDVNGDGASDILIGAYGNNTNGASAGKVYLLLGTRVQ